MATAIGTCALFVVVVGLIVASRIGLARYYAIRDHKTDVPMFGGAVRLILWEQSEGLILLRYKRVSGVLQSGGGTRFIFPIRGEELRARVSLRYRMLTWEDPAVLTRESIQVHIKVALWWKVADLEKYVFNIDPEIHVENAEQNIGILGAAEEWLKLLTESTLRTLVSRTSVALLVSANASHYLHVDSGRDEAAASSLNVASADVVAGELAKLLEPKATEYGLAIQRVEIQDIGLASEIQEAVNRVWKASLLPAQTEQEMRARQIELQRAAEVLGVDAVVMNEVLKNFQGASFLNFPAFLENLMSSLGTKVASSKPELGAQSRPSLPSSAGDRST